MKNSFITKRMIAFVVKDLMQDMPFSKITIQQIMSIAKFRRQTFYDYFEDKYQLLEWLYEQDLKENVNDYIGYEHWSEVFERFFIYIERNKSFMYHTIESSTETKFNEFFYQQNHKLVCTLVDELLEEKDCKRTSNNDFQIEFYTHALTGVCLTWIENHCNDERELLYRNMQKQLESMFG